MNGARTSRRERSEPAAQAADPPLTLRPLDSDEAAKWRTELHRRWPAEATTELAARLAPGSPMEQFIVSVMTLSPFLRDVVLAGSGDLEWLLSRPFAAGIDGIVAEIRNSAATASEAELMVLLRVARRRAALLVALADLGGWWKGEQVTEALTRLADASLKAATSHLLRRFAAEAALALPDADDPERGSGLIVVAMGKYGARELNYSSDIDLIVFFDAHSDSLRTDDPVSLFSKFAKSLVRILQERTGDGYAFRVDLRLRPDPGSTPLAVPTDLARNYYEAYGQNWERAALIKARQVAGDVAAGESFLQEIVPFIWRRHLDFAAIADIHSIKRQIHAHRGHGEIAVAGHNVKLGRGGIREIEFFTQTQQLIAGGRMPQLRQRATVDALGALAENGWISAADRDRMAQAYWYLRAVEHRIQMVADQQSHELPTDEEGLRRIALMMGEASAAGFSQSLVGVLKTVEQTYARLFEAAPALTGKGGNLVFTGDEDDPATVATLQQMGFAQPSEAIKIVRGWHFGRFPAVRSAQAREMLTELAPALLEAIAESGAPDATLFAFDRFVAGLPAGIQLFSLLRSNTALMRLLVRILAGAPRLAAIITHRPHVFDGLLDPSLSAGIPGRDEFRLRLQAAIERAADYEAALDAARIFAAEQKFLIGVRIIGRTIGAEQAGWAFSDLADAVIDILVRRVEVEFARRHGYVAGARLCVLGMGRLGSRELNAGSDLDLILLYDHDPAAEQSDGRKPLPVSTYFLRLAQRLIAAMSAPTAEGVIYALDFRLRPSGNAGPLATHIDAFARYQAEEAWTWERQALTRARVVAGDRQLSAKVETEIDRAIGGTVPASQLREDVREMRAVIDREKPTDNVFDVKNVPGGLTDIEFIAQWLVLSAGKRPDGDNPASAKAMLEAAPGGVLLAEEFDTLLRAHSFYSALLQIMRLCTDEPIDVAALAPGLQRMICEAVDLPDIATVVGQLRTEQRAVRSIFERLLGEIRPADRAGKRAAGGLHRG